MIGYFYWDPDPILFTIPYVERSIRWYGVLFAVGFFLAYSIALRVIARVLQETPRFSVKDVENWERFVEDLRYKRDAAFLLARLSADTRKRIENGDALSDHDKDALVEALNATFTYKEMRKGGYRENRSGSYALSDENVHRQSIESLFKGAFYSLSARAKQFADILFMWIFLGTLIGARFGHVIFYRDPTEYLTHPLLFLAVWEGGLASHGALIGILCGALYAYGRVKERFQGVSFRTVLDILALPVAFAGIFIRLGNFVNQEILGKVTLVPWASIFMHPLDGSAPVPRHPVQLYEALVYATTACILYQLWRMDLFKDPGKIAGWFFILVFGGRFVCEFFKDTQGVYDSALPLMTGQLLSIPAVALGIFLLRYKKVQKEAKLS